MSSEKRRRILDMKQSPPETIHFVQLLRDVRLASARGSSKQADQRRQESEQASFERGRVEGERSLSEQLMRQRAELIQLQNGVLESLRQVVPQVKEDCQALLVNLALEVAKKLVADLPVSVEMVEAAVREALAHAEESPEFNVFLHPEDLTLLEQVNSSLKQIKGGIHFHSSNEVTRGGCLVQTSFGVLDARRETKFESLKKSLLP